MRNSQLQVITAWVWNKERLIYSRYFVKKMSHWSNGMSFSSQATCFPCCLFPIFKRPNVRHNFSGLHPPRPYLLFLQLFNKSKQKKITPLIKRELSPLCRLAVSKQFLAAVMKHKIDVLLFTARVLAPRKSSRESEWTASYPRGDYRFELRIKRTPNDCASRELTGWLI